MNRNIKVAGVTAMLLAASYLAPKVCASGFGDLLQNVVGRYSSQPYNGQEYGVQPYSTVYSNEYRTGDNYYSRYGTADIEQELQSAASRINRGRNSGQISQMEASHLGGMLQNIKQQAFNMHQSGNGINQREQSQLRDQLANLNSRISNELSDRRQEAYRGHHYQLEHNGYNSHYSNDNFDQSNTPLWY